MFRFAQHDSASHMMIYARNKFSGEANALQRSRVNRIIQHSSVVEDAAGRKKASTVALNTQQAAAAQRRTAIEARRLKNRLRKGFRG